MKSNAENVVYPFIQSTDDGKTVVTFSCQAASSSTCPAAFSLLHFFMLAPHKVKVMSADELNDCHKYKFVVEELQPMNRGSNISGGCRLSKTFDLFGQLQLLAVWNLYVLLCLCGFLWDDPRTCLLG